MSRLAWMNPTTLQEVDEPGPGVAIGYGSPIVVCPGIADPTRLTVWDGNLRLEAAKRLGFEAVPCVIYDDPKQYEQVYAELNTNVPGPTDVAARLRAAESFFVRNRHGKGQVYDLREIALAIVGTEVTHTSGRLMDVWHETYDRDEGEPGKPFFHKKGDARYFLSYDIELAAARYMVAVMQGQPFSVHEYEPIQAVKF